MIHVHIFGALNKYRMVCCLTTIIHQGHRVELSTEINSVNLQLDMQHLSTLLLACFNAGGSLTFLSIYIR